MGDYAKLYNVIGNSGNVTGSAVERAQKFGNSGYSFVMGLIGDPSKKGGTGILSIPTVNDSYNYLLLISFVICVFGFIKYAKNISTPIQGFKLILFFCSVVLVIANFDRMVISALDMTYSLSPVIDFSLIISKWKSLLIVTGGLWEAITTQFATGFILLLMTIAYFICLISMSIQGLIIAISILLSPLIIALICIKETSDAAVKFFLTVASVCLWPFAYSMAVSCGNYMLKAYLGGVEVGISSDLASMTKADSAGAFLENTGKVTNAIFGHGVQTQYAYSLLIPPEVNTISQHSALVASIVFVLFAIVFYVILPMIITKMMSGSSPVEAALGSVAKGGGIVAMVVGGGYVLGRGGGSFGNFLPRRGASNLDKGLSTAGDALAGRTVSEMASNDTSNQKVSSKSSKIAASQVNNNNNNNNNNSASVNNNSDLSGNIVAETESDTGNQHVNTKSSTNAESYTPTGTNSDIYQRSSTGSQTNPGLSSVNIETNYSEPSSQSAHVSSSDKAEF